MCLITSLRAAALNQHLDDEVGEHVLALWRYPGGGWDLVLAPQCPLHNLHPPQRDKPDYRSAACSLMAGLLQAMFGNHKTAGGLHTYSITCRPAAA